MARVVGLASGSTGAVRAVGGRSGGSDGEQHGQREQPQGGEGFQEHRAIRKRLGSAQCSAGGRPLQANRRLLPVFSGAAVVFGGYLLMTSCGQIFLPAFAMLSAMSKYA